MRSINPARALMTPSVTIPWIAKGQADLPLIVVASVIAMFASIAVATGSGLVMRVAAAVVCVAAISLLFAWTKHLELALYSLIPLMTVVRVEPAPPDFVTVGLIGALAIRGELWKFRPPRMVTVAFVLLVLVHIPGLLIAADRGTAERFTAATFLVMAIAYVVFQLASRDPRHAGGAYVLAAVILGVETLIAMAPLPIAAGLRMDQFRVEGLFKDPNVFGPFAVPAVVLLTAGRPALPWALRAVAFVLAVISIPASLSRGAIIVLVAALLVLAAVSALRRWRGAFATSAGILVAGFIGLVIFISRPGSSIAEERLSLGAQLYDAQRFEGQLAGLKEFLAHPLSFGIGPGQYDGIIGQPSHETYLRTLVELGPLSLVALVLLLWASIRLIRRPDLLTVAWSACVIGFATYGFFIDILHWRHFWVVLAVPLAIDAWHGRRSTGTPTEAATS
jgi:hypothetical protein